MKKLSASLREPDPDAASYRAPMCVKEVRCFRLTGGLTSYPVCPRCQRTLDREYLRFCDSCGQHLDWQDFSKAIIVLLP